MSDPIDERLHRNLQEVLGEGDAARRRAAINELYTEDCRLHAPPGLFVGQALDKFAGDLRVTFIEARPAQRRRSRRFSATA